MVLLSGFLLLIAQQQERRNNTVQSSEVTHTLDHLKEVIELNSLISQSRDRNIGGHSHTGVNRVSQDQTSNFSNPRNTTSFHSSYCSNEIQLTNDSLILGSNKTSPARLVKTQIAGLHPFSSFWMRLRISPPNKLSGDADAALVTTLRTHGIITIDPEELADFCSILELSQLNPMERLFPQLKPGLL